MVIIVLHKYHIKSKFYCLFCFCTMLQLLSKQVTTQKCHTTPKERIQILLSLQKGYTTREISRARHINPSTVSRIKKRWLENHSVENLPKSGRPLITNKPTQKKIINLITSRRCLLLLKSKTIYKNKKILIFQ